jgi:glutamyl-tRNA synthetase
MNCEIKNKELAELLFPSITQTPEDLLKKYPIRKTPAFRFAPSPTGYLHIGNLMTCNIVSCVAKSMGGVYFLRIEDTDQERFVEGATEYLISALADFDIQFTEGFDGVKNFGNYAPYVQSKRIDLYHVFARRLVQLGSAYPCFCSGEQLESLRKTQENKKQKTGYYGEYSVCKHLSIEQIKQNLVSNKPWVLRFDTDDVDGTRIVWKDLIKGDMSLPAEVNNPVIIKANGIPPYNFAHVVDDTLMRVSHVTRSDEWLVSTAEHIQLFNALGLPHPHYAHLPALCVEENGSKRKISKRKDKMALVGNFVDDGYPREAIIEYLLTLSNTNFELWRIKNPDLPFTAFNATLEKIGSNSPLFDWNKLNDISKNIIAKKTIKQIDSEVSEYFRHAKFLKTPHAEIVYENIGKVHAVLAIDRETPKPRKDIIKYGDIYELYSYLFNTPQNPEQQTHDVTTVLAVLSAFLKTYNQTDTKEEWFAKIKQLCMPLGFAENTKDYKQSPESYRGHVGDITQIIRIAITGKTNTPDLYEILKIIGKDEVLRRIARI